MTFEQILHEEIGKQSPVDAARDYFDEAVCDMKMSTLKAAVIAYAEQERAKAFEAARETYMDAIENNYGIVTRRAKTYPTYTDYSEKNPLV